MDLNSTCHTDIAPYSITTIVFTAYDKNQMLSNMYARLVWKVRIVLFSPLDGNYKSERKNVRLGTSCTSGESNQSQYPPHVEAGKGNVFFLRISTPALMLSLSSSNYARIAFYTVQLSSSK